MFVIFEAGPQEVLSSIARDANSLVAPFWKNGDNITRRGIGVGQILGWETLVDSEYASNPIRGIADQAIGDDKYLFFGTIDRLFSWDGTNLDIPGFGYNGVVSSSANDIATSWSFQQWEDWMIAVNGVDSAQIWKGSTFSNLLSSPVDAPDIVTSYSGYAILIKRVSIYWSALDNPESWDAENDILIIRNSDSDIYAAVPLGDSIALYGKNTMHRLSFLGSPNFFGVKKALDGIGVESKYAVVSIGRQNYGFNRRGIFRTDGVSVEYIAEPWFHNILNDINWDQAAKINALVTDCGIKFFVPYNGATEPNLAITYCPKANFVSFENYGRTASLPRGIYDYPIGIDNNGVLYLHEKGNDADGGSIGGTVTSKIFNLASLVASRRRVIISTETAFSIEAIRLVFETLEGNVKFECAFLEQPDDTPTWEEFASPTSLNSLAYIERDCIYFQFRLTALDSTTDWVLNGIQVLGLEPGGENL